ncbi:MAG TPA: DNA repair protein RecO, partial [Clostridiales bacterium]|nr:DNA repair protein RecO [Clostridiales bacterium]
MHHKVKGIVIKESSQGENSKLLTVLTELDGVITVKAKGARSILASNLKSVQIFACSNMLLYCKNGYYTLVDAELIDDFYAVRESIESFALASYLCEVSGSVAIKDSENSVVLQLLLNSLYALSRNFASVRFIKAVFEFRLACLIAFEPDINTCAKCETELDLSAQNVLDVQNGIFLCSACSGVTESSVTEYGTGISVSRTVIDALRYIINAKSSR